MKISPLFFFCSYRDRDRDRDRDSGSDDEKYIEKPQAMASLHPFNSFSLQ